MLRKIRRVQRRFLCFPRDHVKVMDIDAVGTFNVTRAAFEALRQSPYGGVVKLGVVKRRRRVVTFLLGEGARPW